MLPLQGVRVLDFTERLQGPYATQMLGDMGAEIIKVERPNPRTPDGRPDERYGAHGRYGHDHEDSTIYSSGFLACNRNKKSVTVNLKHEAGKEVIRRLLPTIDVVYENFRPGVMRRLGFGYEDCKAISPSIIYASASGYGQDGPYEERPGQDLLAQAIGGFGTINQAGDGRPTPVGMSITDMLGAMNGAYAVAVALVHRQRTGEGQRVSVSLLDSCVAAQSEQAVHFLNTDAGEPRRETPMHAHPYIPPPYGFYATKDGYVALSSGRQIPALSRILGLDDLSQDPRFSSYEGRVRNKAAMEEIIEAALRARTTAEWLTMMEPEDIFVAPVNSFADAFSDPQVRHNQMVVEVDSPVGPLRLLGVPWKLSRTPPSVRTAPPLLGQHTDEVLGALGYTPDELADMRAVEAI